MQMARLVNDLREDGIELEVYCLHSPDGEDTEIGEKKLRTGGIFYQRLLGNIFSIFFLIRRTNTQYCLSSFSHISLLLSLLKLIVPFGLIVRESNDPFRHKYKRYGFQWAYSAAHRFYLRRADLIIASSPHMKSRITKFLKNEVEVSDRLVVINNYREPRMTRRGGLVSKTSSQWPKTTYPSKEIHEKYDLAMIGRLASVKNIDFVIRMLHRNLPSSFRLHIIGNGALRAELVDLCVKLKISDRVIFHGWVEYPFDQVQFDILVIASSYEGTSNVLLEALGRKVPVLCDSRLELTPSPCDYNLSDKRKLMQYFSDEVDLAEKILEFVMQRNLGLETGPSIYGDISTDLSPLKRDWRFSKKSEGYERLRALCGQS